MNRHTSLPPLPFDAKFPPFVSADLTVDEPATPEQSPRPIFTPNDLRHSSPYPSSNAHPPPPPSSAHVRRPSSPRPMDRMNPHAKRFSGQHAFKAPPVSPSALVHAHLASASSSKDVGILPSATTSPTSVKTQPALSRLSFGNFIGTLGGWSPSAASPTGSVASQQSQQQLNKSQHSHIPSNSSRLAREPPSGHMNIITMTEEPEDEEEIYMTSSAPGGRRTPSWSTRVVGNTRPKRYITAEEQKKPRQSRLAALDFTAGCCSDERLYVV